jgi:hypothetical protein
METALASSRDRAPLRGRANECGLLDGSIADVRPGRRAERALAPAQAHLQAGSFEVALQLLASAEAGRLDELGRARVGLLRGQIAFASSAGGEDPELLLKAATQLEPLDGALARETYWTRGRLRGSRAGSRVPGLSRRSPGQP